MLRIHHRKRQVQREEAVHLTVGLLLGGLLGLDDTGINFSLKFFVLTKMAFVHLEKGYCFRLQLQPAVH